MINAGKAGFLSLFIGSYFYLAGVTSFSPAYFLFIIAFVFLLILFSKNTYFKIDTLIIVNLLIFIVALINQIGISDFRRPVVSFICFLLYILTILIGNRLSYQDIKKLSILSLNISIILFLAEFYFRFNNNWKIIFNPELYSQETKLFYNFKEGSIMFMDSNHVAIVLLLLYFFTFYLIREHKERLFYILAFYAFFITFTFSRAVWITTLLFSILYYFHKPNKRLILYFPIIFIVGGASNFIYQFFSKDLSFLTKFDIYFATIKYINDSTYWQIIRGVGYGNSYDFLGIGTHNLFITYFVEGGLITLVLILMLYLLMFIKNNGKFLYLLLPFILAGMSFAPQVQTFLYIPLATIYLLEIKKTNE